MIHVFCNYFLPGNSLIITVAIELVVDGKDLAVTAAVRTHWPPRRRPEKLCAKCGLENDQLDSAAAAAVVGVRDC